MPGEYRIRPVARADYPMILVWLSEPHIGGWLGDPEAEIALIEEDMNTGPTDMRSVLSKDVPFAFVQDYPAHHWRAPQFSGAHEKARAVDTFLGDPAFPGKGHASAYLRQRARRPKASGAPWILTDPDPRNHRAIAAYTCAGFQPLGTRTCPKGDPVLVMRFEDADLAPSPHQPTYS